MISHLTHWSSTGVDLVHILPHAVSGPSSTISAVPPPSTCAPHTILSVCLFYAGSTGHSLHHSALTIFYVCFANFRCSVLQEGYSQEV